MNISFSENLKKFREFAGMSKAELARRVGVSDVTLGQWESGKISPRMGKIEIIADVLGITTDELIFESSPVTVSESKGEHITNTINTQRKLYGSIAAGKPLEMIEALDYIDIPQTIAEKYPNAFLLKITGDSMNKVIPDGAYALIDPCEEAINGEIYAVVVNGYDATLKRFFKLSNSIALEPESYNLEHETQTFRCEGEINVKIIGKLVWFMAPYNIKF